MASRAVQGEGGSSLKALATCCSAHPTPVVKLHLEAHSLLVSGPQLLASLCLC